MKLAINYTLFALLATVANIGAQDLIIRLYPGAYSITLSILVGTGIGIIVKYVLDKKYIFKYKTTSLAHDATTLFAYATMGVFTTIIFWGFEFGFHYLFETKQMRYLGGVIGLALGYFLKYRLDKRFVFKASTS